MENSDFLVVNFSPVGSNYLWKGKPCLVPYLLVVRRMLQLTIAALFVWWYFDFIWFLPTQIVTAFYAVCLLCGIREWFLTEYYLTPTEAVVHIGKKFCHYAYNKITKDNYRVRCHPVEALWRCRTIQYGRNYDYSSSRKEETRLWRKRTRFWCVKDYENIQEIVSVKLFR